MGDWLWYDYGGSGDQELHRLDVRKQKDGQHAIFRRSGSPIDIRSISPHPNTDGYESDQEDLVGHFEYYPDGSAQFSMKKGSTIDEITKRTGNTGHFEEYKNTTSHDLDKLKDLMTSGFSRKDGELRGGSNTHNLGIGKYQNQDVYTPFGNSPREIAEARQASTVEQEMMKDVLNKWTEAGQPKTGWSYNPTTGVAQHLVQNPPPPPTMVAPPLVQYPLPPPPGHPYAFFPQPPPPGPWNM